MGGAKKNFLSRQKFYPRNFRDNRYPKRLKNGEKENQKL
jgi:hypothetical protein